MYLFFSTGIRPKILLDHLVTYSLFFSYAHTTKRLNVFVGLLNRVHVLVVGVTPPLRPLTEYYLFTIYCFQLIHSANSYKIIDIGYHNTISVSYTHLDVYKRQLLEFC